VIAEPERRAHSARRPPRRPLSKVRQPQILATTVELLREQGLWSVRVSDVAERAGTSPAGVIYYFGTKDELFKAAIADADATFYATVWPELDRLESAAERLAWLLVRSSRSDWVLWMDLWVYARRHPELLETQRAFAERWCATIADVIRHGQERDEFAPGDAGALAVRLAAAAAAAGCAAGAARAAIRCAGYGTGARVPRARRPAARPYPQADTRE